jgi:hypothetical protein
MTVMRSCMASCTLVSDKARENFLLILFFPYTFLSSQDCIDYFNILSSSVNLFAYNSVYTQSNTLRLRVHLLRRKSWSRSGDKEDGLRYERCWFSYPHNPAGDPGVHFVALPHK